MKMHSTILLILWSKKISTVCSGKWTILRQIKGKSQIIFKSQFFFEFSTQDSSTKSLKHLLVTFDVLNNNSFYSQLTFCYILNNFDTFFTFIFTKILIPFLSLFLPFIFFFCRKTSFACFFLETFSLFLIIFIYHFIYTKNYENHFSFKLKKKKNKIKY